MTIAGSDSSGGAGLQADLKTFAALGVYGASVVTNITAQNTTKVASVFAVPPAVINGQLEAVFTDLSVNAVKIGMTGSKEIIAVISSALATWSAAQVVLDPVMRASTGDALCKEDIIKCFIAKLFPLASLITPNIPEAALLLQQPEAKDFAQMQAQAEALLALGARAVLIKGGHLEGNTALDIFYDGEQLRRFERPRVATQNTHGSGCTLAAAIAAELAKGAILVDAVTNAKSYVTGAIRTADQLCVGRGHGPLHHFYRNWKTPV